MIGLSTTDLASYPDYLRQKLAGQLVQTLTVPVGLSTMVTCLFSIDV